MDSNSDEEVRQQCDTMTVDEAMQPSPVMGDEHFGDDDWIHDCWMTLKAEVRRQREASAVTAVNFGKAQLEIARLQTTLTRVAALPVKWRSRPGHAVPEWKLADELATALRDDPQPSAAPKAEPPCWNHRKGCTGKARKNENVFCEECEKRCASTGYSWPEQYNGY